MFCVDVGARLGLGTWMGVRQASLVLEKGSVREENEEGRGF